MKRRTTTTRRGARSGVTSSGSPPSSPTTLASTSVDPKLLPSSTYSSNSTQLSGSSVKATSPRPARESKNASKTSPSTPKSLPVSSTGNVKVPEFLELCMQLVDGAICGELLHRMGPQNLPYCYGRGHRLPGVIYQ